MPQPSERLDQLPGARSMDLDIRFLGVRCVAEYSTPCAVCSGTIEAHTECLVARGRGTMAHRACGEER